MPISGFLGIGKVKKKKGNKDKAYAAIRIAGFLGLLFCAGFLIKGAYDSILSDEMVYGRFCVPVEDKVPWYAFNYGYGMCVLASDFLFFLFWFCLFSILFLVPSFILFRAIVKKKK